MILQMVLGFTPMVAMGRLTAMSLERVRF